MTGFSKKTLNKIRIYIVKAITAVMGLIFIISLSAADDTPFRVLIPMMLISGGWLFLVAYANGWITDTEPWYEREEREAKRNMH